MRNYQIYLIEEEFAMHYYGRERLFFNLFLENITSKNQRLKSILQKQIDYITKEVPADKLKAALRQVNDPAHQFLYKDEMFYKEEKGGKSKAALVVRKESILMKAEGSYEAETSFFESIRRCESSFLAIDFENKCCGWLKPVKERKFV